ICHFVIADAGLVREAGGLDSRFDGAQDHEFLLRLAERLKPHEIHHVPEILYHWRISEHSTAGSAAAKPRAALAGEVAVAEHLKRRGISAKVERRGNLTCYRTRFSFPDDPGVSILIPFRDHIELTRQCVNAIRRHTRGLRYEIILLDNWSQSEEAERFCADQANHPDTSVIRIAEPFNYSLINNRGVAAAKHPYLLFLNNDVFVSDPDWLRNLLQEALADPQVGAVGAKLLYPNGTVQHAGVVLGVGGIADHAFRGLPGEAPGYIAHAISAQEVSAVTAACMLVRRDAFERIGGFDEAELTVAFNDVDLCMKLREAGYRIIFAADVVAEHRESMSRGDDFDEGKLSRFMRENQAMEARWRHALPFDPFYNRNFAREGGVYRDLRVLDPADEARIAPPAPVSHPIAPVHEARPRVAKSKAKETAKPEPREPARRRLRVAS
ncbi:MAG TPA: glycosyltransferase family 2 protein, partial [Acetobacteraceae bacterium]|nr:glycosyltransferase family 2 protein [Acetobacteraceae bacterium]